MTTISTGHIPCCGSNYSSKTCSSMGRLVVLTSAVALTIIGALALVGLGRASTLSCFGHALGRSAAIAFTAIGATVTAAMLAVYLESYCSRPKEKPALPEQQQQQQPAASEQPAPTEPREVAAGSPPLPPEQPCTPLRATRNYAPEDESREPPSGHGHYPTFGPSPEKGGREVLKNSGEDWRNSGEDWRNEDWRNSGEDWRNEDWRNSQPNTAYCEGFPY